MKYEIFKHLVNNIPDDHVCNGWDLIPQDQRSIPYVVISYNNRNNSPAIGKKYFEELLDSISLKYGNSNIVFGGHRGPYYYIYMLMGFLKHGEWWDDEYKGKGMHRTISTVGIPIKGFGKQRLVFNSPHECLDEIVIEYVKAVAKKYGEFEISANGTLSHNDRYITEYYDLNQFAKDFNYYLRIKVENYNALQLWKLGLNTIYTSWEVKIDGNPFLSFDFEPKGNKWQRVKQCVDAVIFFMDDMGFTPENDKNFYYGEDMSKYDASFHKEVDTLIEVNVSSGAITVNYKMTEERRDIIELVKRYKKV